MVGSLMGVSEGGGSILFGQYQYGVGEGLARPEALAVEKFASVSEGRGALVTMGTVAFTRDFGTEPDEEKVKDCTWKVTG